MLKTVGGIAVMILFLLIGFHLWFINHSEKAIEDLITRQSHGKLKASIKKLKIDYFNNKAEIKQLTIFNTDTLGQGTSYRFSTKELKFNLLSKWDLVFHKLLLVDTVIFTSPDIVVTRSKFYIRDTTKKLLLVEELGNVYKAINQSLTVLNLKRFEINDGTVVVKDADISKPPFKLSHIFFSTNKLGIDSANTSGNGKFLFSNRVLLRIAGQTINLRDGKSSIAFSELLIDSKRRLIQITDPNINILSPAGQGNVFIASAGKLNISGLDFNILYKQPLIKIDSVYMENPKGDLQVFANGENKKVNNKKEIPLDYALRHLPVAININHVVLQNGTGSMHLHQAGKTTSFKTKNDNLSIVDIRVNDTAANVISISGFNYTLRHYVGYTPDSIYRYRFDSLQFIDNKIILYNFTAFTVKKNQADLTRNYTVPRFEITDMDWLSFIFHNHFIAKKAVLFNPVFNIEKNKSTINKYNKGGKKSIYQTLSIMDNLLDLNELRILNGEFTFKQEDGFNLNIKKINWDINANELTEAKSFKQLIHSIKELSFDTAIATNPAITLHIAASNFSSKDESLLFKNILLNTNDNRVNANINVVAVSDFSFDNNGLEVNGIHWKDGTIHIVEQNKTVGRIKPVNKGLSFLLNNISANNTSLFFENEKTKAQVFLKTLSANNLGKSIDDQFQLNGLFVIGENAKINLPDGQIQCDKLIIKDEQKSILQNISYKRMINRDTAFIEIPSINFIPFVNKTIITNAIVADSLEIHRPYVFLSGINGAKETSWQGISTNLPDLNIKGAAIDNASLHLSIINDDEKSVFNCKQVSVGVKDLSTQNDKSLLLNHININASDISFNKSNLGFIENRGALNVELGKFLYYPTTQNWQVQLHELLADEVIYKNIKLGNTNTLFSIDKIKIRNATATKADLKQPLNWLVNKSNADIAFDFAHLQNSTTNLQINNFLFSGNKKRMIVDSLSIDPGRNKEDFINRLIYRKDYTTASSGKITIDGINFKDDFLHVSHISGTNAHLDIYSDRLKKQGVETIHLLPTTALKKMNTALRIDTVQINNMAVDYTELNAHTKQTGHVYFTHLNGNVLNIRSKQSMSDSLRINVYGRFLDTMQMHLVINESYMDSLSGLSLQLQLGPGNIVALNTFLEPLVSLKARSGYLDTMSLTAYGNELMAHGNMRLYYHGLKADLLDANNIQHPKFKTRLLSYFANSIAIRNSNDKRYADFNFERVRQKSTIGYFLKMLVQGAAKNVMPQASKVLFRKQEKKMIREKRMNQ